MSDIWRAYTFCEHSCSRCESDLCGCVLLIIIGPAEAKVPPNTQPRLLQDEGFYVGTRPYVSMQNLNRMENRLLKEAGGGYVTRDEEACIEGSEVDPVSDQSSYCLLTVICSLFCECFLNCIVISRVWLLKAIVRMLANCTTPQHFHLKLVTWAFCQMMHFAICAN